MLFPFFFFFSFTKTISIFSQINILIVNLILFPFTHHLCKHTIPTTHSSSITNNRLSNNLHLIVVDIILIMNTNLSTKHNNQWFLALWRWCPQRPSRVCFASRSARHRSALPRTRCSRCCSLASGAPTRALRWWLAGL